MRVTHREGVGKLLIAVPGAEIKLEVNLTNLQKLKQKNSDKHREQYEALEKKLNV